MEAACQPARKPLAGWRLPEGKRATLTRRPLPFPFVMCPAQECFFLMLWHCSWWWWCCFFICCSDSDFCCVALSAGCTFGSRLPGGIRSSGPTPTGSCWRTRRSPPNPLARFRAAATVRCMKTPACSDRSGRAASVAPWPALPASRQQDAGM